MRSQIRSIQRARWFSNAAAAALLAAAGGCTTLPPTARQKVADAAREYERGNYGRAESNADTVIKDYPDVNETAEAYYLRGLCAQRMRRTGFAAKDFERALKLSRRKDLTARCHAALGSMAYDDQRWNVANDHFGQSATLLPPTGSVDEVYYRYGISLMRVSRDAEARVQFARLIQYFPNSIHADEANRYLRNRKTGATSYAIQCGVFSRADSATGVAARLTRAGLTPRIEVEQRNGRSAHVVYVGMYTAQKDAIAALPGVRKTIPDAVVAPR